jgi:2-dehydro-3-deoxyphosphogluconate aldolase/(4S)-4-hydroxy-2-oxoglutarate aldolase
VDLKNAGEWIKAGAACIGVGSSMVTKEAMAKGDWGTIAGNARAFVEAVARARGK